MRGVPIGRLGHTRYFMWHFRVTAGVAAERLPSVRDNVQSTKPHRAGISSLILTFKLCSVALSFAIPYMHISKAIGWVTAGHRGSSSALALSSSGNDHCSPHPGPNQPETPQIAALIFYFKFMCKLVDSNRRIPVFGAPLETTPAEGEEAYVAGRIRKGIGGPLSMKTWL
jgi:hypothetical protein